MNHGGREGNFAAPDNGGGVWVYIVVDHIQSPSVGSALGACESPLSTKMSLGRAQFSEHDVDRTPSGVRMVPNNP